MRSPISSHGRTISFSSSARLWPYLRIIAGAFCTVISVVADPGHHTRIRHRSNDRFDETAAH